MLHLLSLNQIAAKETIVFCCFQFFMVLRKLEFVLNGFVLGLDYYLYNIFHQLACWIQTFFFEGQLSLSIMYVRYLLFRRVKICGLDFA